MSAEQDVFHAFLHEDLSVFTETAFGTLLPSDPYLPNWHMRAIAHALEQVVKGRTKRLIITMPPAVRSRSPLRSPFRPGSWRGIRRAASSA